MSKIKELSKRARAQYKAKHYQRAADYYAELASLDKDNPNWSHRQGEALQGDGDLRGAIEAYQRAAQLYSWKGSPLKGVALCKIILSIDPHHVETREMLLSFHSKQPQVHGEGQPRSRDGNIHRLMMGQSDPVRPDRPTPPQMPVLEFQLDEEPESQEEAVEEDQSGEGFRYLGSLETLEDIPLSSMMPGARALGNTQGSSSVYRIPLSAPPPTPEGERARRTTGVMLSQIIETPLIAAMDNDTLSLFIDHVDIHTCPRGTVIIRQGALGENLYLLLSGEAVIYKGKGETLTELERLKDGAFFGEVALVTERERTATVQATTHCTLLVISRRLMTALIRRRPGILVVILELFRQRMVNALILTHEMFTPFNGFERQWLIQQFSFIEAMPDSTLLYEGRQTNGMYILLSGEGGVARGERALRRLEPGDIFGKTSLLAGQPSLNTVRVTSKSWLLRMDRDVFHDMVMTHPDVLAVIGSMGDTGAHPAAPADGEPPERISLV